MSRPRPSTRRIVIFSIAALILCSASTASAQRDSDAGSGLVEATARAEAFFRAFTAKDMERVESFFAPDARVQRARLGDGAAEIEAFDLATWLAEAGPSIAPLRDFAIEVLGRSGASFGDGVTVSLHFRATGAVGGGTFTNDGVDTFSFVNVDGVWKIALYQSIEKLVFVPGAASGADS
ncbi:MAG: nuclear transport factor 2 family protein [Acidobacteriota bacterium]